MRNSNFKLPLVKIVFQIEKDNIKGIIIQPRILPAMALWYCETNKSFLSI